MECLNQGISPKQGLNMAHFEHAHIEEIKNPVQARQGETSGHMRWVLGTSTLLAVVALGILYLAYMQ